MDNSSVGGNGVLKLFSRWVKPGGHVLQAWTFLLATSNFCQLRFMSNSAEISDPVNFLYYFSCQYPKMGCRAIVTRMKI
ncbi:MAG: hypothetical protein DID90_2727552542 [Candidatus Nitrotoga sp. LAW]|nr:MAG: hypothetical protein DID90_2727552542 [Candidatus Nitrotoga sp. LAW]